MTAEHETLRPPPTAETPLPRVAGEGSGGRGGRGRAKVSPRPRRIPERTCVACRQVAGKRSLVRVVRTTTGGVEIDLTGRKNGRGAYLHADPACWDLALRRNALGAALKVSVAEVDLAAIRAFRDQLREDASPRASSRTGEGEHDDHADTSATTD